MASGKPCDVHFPLRPENSNTSFMQDLMVDHVLSEMEREDFVFIDSWQDYSEQSHDKKVVHTQFNNLLNEEYDPVMSLKTLNECPHHDFIDQSTFLQTIRGYINHKVISVNRVNSHDNKSKLYHQMIKTGMCMNCICKFILKTNALNAIFTRWKQNTQFRSLTLKRFRFEFTNTNILITSNAWFIRAMLHKSNMHCLLKIFKLFFITYLKETNLKEWIIKNKMNVSETFKAWRLPHSEHMHDFAITKNEINICHGLEHSLCSLSSTIINILPLLQLHHIKYLFVENQELKDIANIINSFLRQYCNLDHIKLYSEHPDQFDAFDERNKKEYKQWKKRVSTDKKFAKNWPLKDYKGEPIWIGTKYNLSLDEVWEKVIERQHPFLKRIMFIISSLYQHFYFGRLKLKKLRKEEGGIFDVKLYNKIKIQKKRFDQLSFKDQPMTDYIYAWTQPVTPEYYVWNLIRCHLQCIKANKYFRIEYKQRLCCVACHKQQNKWPQNKLKICKGCKYVTYCSRKCQKYDWVRNRHREICADLGKCFNC